MADMEITSRQWRLSLSFEEGEGVDTPKLYSQITVRPHSGVIGFAQRADRAPSFASVTLYGHRVNKGGLGVPASAEWRWEGDIPEWLKPYVEEARALVLADLVDDGRS